MGFTLTCQWEAKTISTSYEFLQERGDTPLQSHDHVDFVGTLGVPRSWICLKEPHKKRQDSPSLLVFPLGKCRKFNKSTQPSQDGFGYDKWPNLAAWIPPSYGCFKSTNPNRK